MALSDLPNPKWVAAGSQVILKSDFRKSEEAILELATALGSVPPALEWVDTGTLKVRATADSPAKLMLNGFPNVLDPSLSVSADLCDGVLRTNTSDVSMILASGGIWGSAVNSQLYAVLAIAGDADTTFTLKSMPVMAYKSQASQVITPGQLGAPGTTQDFGFTSDEFIGGYIYVLSGDSRGLMRAITANTSGTITYTGTALSMAQGDTFTIFPPTNFKYVGQFFIKATGVIEDNFQAYNGALFLSVGTYYCLPWAIPLVALMAGGGGGGGSDGVSAGGAGTYGQVLYRYLKITIGQVLKIVNGNYGGAGNGGGSPQPGIAGGNSTIGGLTGAALLTAYGGAGGAAAAYDENQPFNENVMATAFVGTTYNKGGAGGLIETAGNGGPGGIGACFIKW